MDHKGENMISGQNIVSGSLPIESGRAQGCFFSGKMAISGSGSSPIEFGRAQGCFFLETWKSGILEAHFWILEALRENPGMLKAVFFWEMAIWDSGSQFWDSGSDSQMDLDLDISYL